MNWQMLIGFGIVAVFSIPFIIVAIGIIKGTSKKGLEKKMDNLENMADMAVKLHYNMINKNEEILKEAANKRANINKEAVRTMANAVKEGFAENMIYCKHCGAAIDSDSKFCGKEQ